MKFLRVLPALFISFVATFSSAAHADDWGCEVLLCLSNPAGPMAVSQCVPPIKRLYAAIFKLHPDPFPTCAMATSQDGSRSYASVDYNNYYDGCPAGTSALPAGSNAVQGTPAQTFTSFSVGIGDGAGLYPSADSPLGRKVCVGKAVGTVNITVGSSSDDSVTYQVGVYDRVAFIDPNVNGFAIKVFMNNNLYRTIRPQL
jgi:hypothetical protein